MKYQTPLQKRSQGIYANKKHIKALLYRKRKKAVTTGGSERRKPKKFTIEVPSIFSLTKNYEKTIYCLQQIKDLFQKRAKGKMYKEDRFEIKLYNIKEIQPAAALILAAELDRGQKICGSKLKPKKLLDWKPDVLKLLYDLGMFDLLDTREEEKQKVSKRLKKQKHSSAALPFVSGYQNNREETDALYKELRDMFRQLSAPSDKESAPFKEVEEENALCVALSEASLNCVHHAYPENSQLKYMTKDKRWWAAATYHKDKKIVRFFVYDQGVGIAKTLGKTDYGKGILALAEKMLKSDDEGFIIKKLLENPKSSTGNSNRGKGFPQMKEAVRRQGDSLRILSGKGRAEYRCGANNIDYKKFNRHVGGTLLEWRFRLDKDKRLGNDE